MASPPSKLRARLTMAQLEHSPIGILQGDQCFEGAGVPGVTALSPFPALDASHGNGFPCRRSHGDPMPGREHAGGHYTAHP